MQNCEVLARRIYCELFDVTGGRPLQWVMLQTVADHLKVDGVALQQAVDLGVDLGWLEAKKTPAQYVCLSDKGRGDRL